MNNNNSENKISAIEILLREYEELHREIRNIHERRVVIFKISIAATMTLLGYIIAGMVFYMQAKAREACIFQKL